MTKTTVAVFDGEVLRLREPLDLEPNTVVHVTITSIESSTSEPDLLTQINAAYADELDTSEKRVLTAARQQYRKLVETDAHF